MEILTDNPLLAIFVKIVLIIIVAFFTWLLTRYFLKHLTKRLQAIDDEKNSDFDLRVKTVMRFVRSGSIAMIFFTAIFFIFETLNVDLTPVLASVGIAGLAVSVGAQTLIEDAIAGLSFMLEGQFNVGDEIKVKGIKGKVTDITLRNTHLREVDGTLHIVPNGEIRIITNTAAGWSRARLDILVPYTESIDKAEAYIMESLKTLNSDDELKKLITGDFRLVGPEDLTEHGSSYRLLARVVPGEQGKVERAMRRNLMYLFKKHGIRIANATQEIILYTPNDEVKVVNTVKPADESKKKEEEKTAEKDDVAHKKVPNKNLDMPDPKKKVTPTATDLIQGKLSSKLQ